MKTSSTIFRATLVAAACFSSYTVLSQICKPVSERTGEVGCWITANTSLGLLPKEPIYWHLYTYPTRAEAESAKGPRGTVVESLGKPPGEERVLRTGDFGGERPTARGLQASAQEVKLILGKAQGLRGSHF